MDIKNVSGKVLFSDGLVTIKETLINAVEQGANLRGANLQGANLRGANLQGANLQGAYLQEANLQGANLQGAYLQGAYLRGAYLRGANLQWANLQMANLQGAYLQGAYLRGANLQEANLKGAYLQGAYLQEANLQEANLQGANLQGAYLQGAYLPDFSIVPERGVFTAFKKTSKGVIEIIIPEDAKRVSSLVGRKCRASHVVVVGGDGVGGKSPTHGNLTYNVGDTLYADSFDDDIRVECTHGIHFFMTEKEAREY